MGLQEIVGTAVQTELSGDMTDVSTSFTIDDASGWPTGGSGNPFVVTVGKGTASEEKILCASRTGTTIAVTTRGYDSTSPAPHSTGVGAIHSISAALLAEMNAHVNDDTRDDHSQYLPAAASVAGAGLAVTTRVLSVNVDNSTLEIAADIVRMKDAGTTAAKLASNAVTTPKVIDAAITLAKMADLATARLLGRATAGTGVPEAITLGSSLVFVGTALQRPALTGDVTAAADSNALAIGAGKVTAAMFATGLRPTFVVADATARLALSPSDGDLCVETSTDRYYGWSGGSWRYLCGGSNPMAARAYSTVATSCVGGTYTKLVFGTEQYDYGNNFASSTYTAPETRDYDIRARAATIGQTASERFLVSIYVDGVELAQGTDVTCGTAGATGLGGPVIARLPLNAGAAVDIRVFCSVTRNSGASFASQYFEVVGV